MYCFELTHPPQIMHVALSCVTVKSVLYYWSQEDICDSLNISSDVAGATFMAAGTICSVVTKNIT